LLEYGALVALALLIVWVALLILSALGRLNAIPFGIASLLLVLTIPFFWLSPEIAGLATLKIGSLKTSAEQATRYFAEIEKVRAKVEAAAQAVNAATASFNKEMAAMASFKNQIDTAQAEIATMLTKVEIQEQTINTATESLKRAMADAQALTSKTQNRSGDRKLTDDQVAKIADRLIEFKGQQFGIVPYWELSESLSIAKKIVKALTMADWKLTPPPSATFLAEGISGVVVYVNPGASVKTKRATSALVLALNDEGITASLRKKEASGPEDKIEISVGTRP
jgi:hypothetical protein